VSEYQVKQTNGIEKLAAALAAAQAKIGPVVANSHVDFQSLKGRRVNFSYVGFDAAWSADVRAALAEQGLAVTQSVSTEESGCESEGFPVYHLRVITVLMHNSGQFAESSVWLPTTDPSPNNAGKIWTILRRHAFKAAVGIVDVDDGEGGQTDDPEPERRPRRQSPGGGKVSGSVPDTIEALKAATDVNEFLKGAQVVFNLNGAAAVTTLIGDPEDGSWQFDPGQVPYWVDELQAAVDNYKDS